jgi:DNA-binding beta-propeller fold protein YncE
MDRRSFVQLAALGSVFALPQGLAGCGDLTDVETPAGRGAVVANGARARRFGGSDGSFFDVYVRDNRVDFFAPTGELRGRVTSGLNAPVSLAVDAPNATTGRVLVLELGGARVQAFDRDARWLGTFAPRLDLHSPLDLAIAPDSGNVAIADTLHHRVALLDGAGNLIRTLGSLGSRNGDLNGPASVAFGPDGSRLFVADAGNARVQVYSQGGRVLGGFGGYGTRPGQFLRPRCVRLDNEGYAYVADALAGHVSVFDPGYGFVHRFRTMLEDGAPGVPTWMSSQPDGSFHFSAVAGAPG